jgi:hypothetical protein
MDKPDEGDPTIIYTSAIREPKQLEKSVLDLSEVPAPNIRNIKALAIDDPRGFD